MSGEDVAGAALAGRPAGEDARVHSASDPKAHVEFHQKDALPSIIAAALASGTLLVGGRFRLCGGLLVREAGR